MKILIDNGHGENTPGKCSPDKSLREYAWNREIADRVVSELKVRGYDADLVTPELYDVPLRERVRRANYWCSRLGSQNVVLCSIHINAAGSDGKWHDANGWSVFVSANASDRSKALCNIMWNEAGKVSRRMRRPTAWQNYWIKSLSITRDTKCPAVLTENFFMDNLTDCEWLKSDDGKCACVRIHVDALSEYVDRYAKG